MGSGDQNRYVAAMPVQWIDTGGADPAVVYSSWEEFSPSSDKIDKARRFRDEALLHLDDVYTLARHLLHDAADADDATLECYVRAFEHFDGYGGLAMKPWLFTILRNICTAEHACRTSAPTAVAEETTKNSEYPSLWHKPRATAEAEVLRVHDVATIRRLVDTLAEPFRETLVLQAFNNLSYRQIAHVIGVPIGTVMLRLARARSMLRWAWITREKREE